MPDGPKSKSKTPDARQTVDGDIHEALAKREGDNAKIIDRMRERVRGGE